MGLLENIQSGCENKPPRIMVYGQEGVGKSTFGASAPDPVFIQTEDGLGEIDTCKFPLAQSVGDVIAELTALRDEEHNFRTVVIDSLDWLERLIFDEVCKEFGVRSWTNVGQMLDKRPGLLDMLDKCWTLMSNI